MESSQKMGSEFYKYLNDSLFVKSIQKENHSRIFFLNFGICMCFKYLLK